MPGLSPGRAVTGMRDSRSDGRTDRHLRKHIRAGRTGEPFRSCCGALGIPFPYFAENGAAVEHEQLGNLGNRAVVLDGPDQEIPFNVRHDFAQRPAAVEVLIGKGQGAFLSRNGGGQIARGYLRALGGNDQSMHDVLQFGQL